MFALPVAKNQSDRIPHRSLTSQRSKTPFINHHVHHTKNEGSHNNEGNSTIATAQHPHWNFAETPVFAHDERRYPNSDLNVPIQAKFKSGESNDPLEHEAESIADHVVGTTPPARSVAHLDRKNLQGDEELSPTTKSHS